LSLYTSKETLMEYIRMDIPDGNHTFQTNANNELVDIDVEFVNYYDNVTWTGVDNVGNTTTDSRMLILKFHGDLIIESDARLKPQVRKKGMFVYVNGTLENNGTISMTARGANAEGQNVYICKDENDNLQYIPATGGGGGNRAYGYAGESSVNVKGNNGNDGNNRTTGGGGSGGVYASGGSVHPGEGAYSGAGAHGTSYSGGSGGGAVSLNGGHSNWYGDNGSPNGGAGGRGDTYQKRDHWPTRRAGGGAGNPGGMGEENYDDDPSYQGDNGQVDC
jgi:hypothetical protein